MYNKTISESCLSKNLAVSVIDSKSIEKLKEFLTKHATKNNHVFFFWLTNSTTNFYQYDSQLINIYEKNGPIVKKGMVSCFSRGYTITQKIGIYVGTVFAIAISFCIFMFIISRRNKAVSSRVYLLNINVIKLNVQRINI